MLLDALFGRDCFLNEIIWAYDYGAKSKSRWPTKHDTILVYVKSPTGYHFDSAAVDREPYMAPGLVTPEKVARGKLPTDVWWHTIVSPTGKEKTGYPTQKPEGILRRIVQASSREGDWVLDFFAGSGTTGVVAAALGRRFVLVDQSAEAIAVMRSGWREVDRCNSRSSRRRWRAPHDEVSPARLADQPGGIPLRHRRRADLGVHPQHRPGRAAGRAVRLPRHAELGVRPRRLLRRRLLPDRTRTSPPMCWNTSRCTSGSGFVTGCCSLCFTWPPGVIR